MVVSTDAGFNLPVEFSEACDILIYGNKGGNRTITKVEMTFTNGASSIVWLVNSASFISSGNSFTWENTAGVQEVFLNPVSNGTANNLYVSNLTVYYY